MKRLLVVLLAILPLTLSAQRIDLSGYWDFAIDSTDVGVAQKWQKKQFAEQVKLPGSLPLPLVVIDPGSFTVSSKSIRYHPFSTPTSSESMRKLQSPERSIPSARAHDNGMTSRHNNKKRFICCVGYSSTIYMSQAGMLTSSPVATDFPVSKSFPSGKR